MKLPLPAEVTRVLRSERRPEERGRRRRIAAVAQGLALPLAVLVAMTGWKATASASSGEGVLEPNGRGLQLLGGREAILLEQTEHARQAARLRAVTLYRLLRLVGGQRSLTGAVGADQSRVGARSVALATAVLARDLEEARSLRAELERVRGERTALSTGVGGQEGTPADADAARSPGPLEAVSPSGSCGSAACDATPAALRGPPPAFLRPVSGALITPFGVGRDRATGAWIFRAAATFAVSAREIVRSPAAGRVVRVADSVAGGVAVVLTIPAAIPAASTASPASTWTVVLSGLDSVAVAPGEDVARGAPLGTAPAGPGGTVRVETWRGRSPVDPAAVLRVRDKR